MRLFIIFFILLTQLFFNITTASSTKLINVSLNKTAKKNIHQYQHHKHQFIKNRIKKYYLLNLNKIKLKKQKKIHIKKINNSHYRRYQKVRKIILNKLMQQLGKPYQWGGNSPNTGFDCSGLIWYVYKDLVKYKFPRTANAMYHIHNATPIKRNLLQKGDLVFFRIKTYRAADHVGVYLGHGKFIQSPRTGKDIRINILNNNYWQKHYIGARRMITIKTVR
ncbi:C40 family peptidase [Pantoea sp. Aalb]|uniref:C40 family peptidase n=1 Tax=Pantoea sp. Aalb TaxID=2576762 RepID=UPI0013253E64|nr:C40 family peptidase [Pantoea sp. Aalb]MXP67420.1 NlpC/P60 family protein [Pantoea sp. Aalb]